MFKFKFQLNTLSIMWRALIASFVCEWYGHNIANNFNFAGAMKIDQEYFL